MRTLLILLTIFLASCGANKALVRMNTCEHILGDLAKCETVDE